MKYYYNTINTESGRRVSVSLRVHLLFNHSVSRRLLRIFLLQITCYFFVVFPSHLLPSPCFSPSYSSSRNSDFFLPSSTRAELRLPTLLRGRAGHTIILYDFFPDFFLCNLSAAILLPVLWSGRNYLVRLTENGSSLEPNLPSLCSLSWKNDYIDPSRF